jgi:hypothetical protein
VYEVNEISWELMQPWLEISHCSARVKSHVRVA